MVRRSATLALVGLLGLALGPVCAVADAAPAQNAAPAKVRTLHSFALYNNAKYAKGFKHFDYVNPNAPKGGTIHVGAIGTYDTFNPFAITGVPAITQFAGLPLLYDTLMKPSADEIGVDYPLIAESLTVPGDYSWVEFKLNPKARWHDGKPITPQDVVFTYNELEKFALPAWQNILPKVTKAEVTGPHTVKFTFAEKNNPRAISDLCMMMPIIPEHFWKGKDFTAPIITPPLTSGPYKITSYDLGRSYTVSRVKDYWAKDLAANVGQYNFDKIVTDYYRDSGVMFEAFKAGSIDERMETSEKNWATAYVWPAVKDGQVIRKVMTAPNYTFFQGMFYNLRRPLFQDPVLRKALAYAYDFHWMNKNLFYGNFVRTKSYFGISDMAQRGLPSTAELKLLEPLKSQVPPEVFTKVFNPPDTDGTQDGLRANLRKAMQMLEGAGYRIQNGKLVSPVTHKPVEFSILLANPSLEPVVNHWARNLKLIGVTAHLHTVDVTQYVSLMHKFDFDMMVGQLPFRSTPGRELLTVFGSATANTPGGYNWAGIHNPAVDALAKDAVQAETRPGLDAATRAMDRVLLWNWYTIPMYSNGGKLDVAYWSRFGKPAHQDDLGNLYETTWWIDPQKDAALKAARGTAD